MNNFSRKYSPYIYRERETEVMLDYLQDIKNSIQSSMPFLQCFGCRTRREMTGRIIDKAQALIVRIDKEFGHSIIGLNQGPQSTPGHDDYRSIQFQLPTRSDIDQTDFHSTELMTRLTQLQNRLSRFEKYLKNTPANTPKYNRLQVQHKYVQRQIRQVKRKIEMQ
jgi:hypothetical protein